MKALSLGRSLPVLCFCLLTPLFFLSACSQGGDPALIGKWKAKDGSETVEIRSNGRWVDANQDSDITSATWEWDDTNHIRLTATHKVVGSASGVMKVTLTGDTLVLKDEDGAKEYTRVK